MCEERKYLMAYLAGAMDGDGSFSIIKLKGERSPLYVPYFQFANLSENLSRLLKKTFGGSIFMRKPFVLKSGKMSSAIFHWNIRGAKACKNALENLLPFLCIKKERAELLSQYIKDHPFKRGIIMSPEELWDRERKYLKMLDHNRNRKFKGICSQQTNILSKDPSFWSYMAGIMDTDGSFCIKRQTQNAGTPGVKNHRYSCVIQLSFADCHVVNLLRSKLPFGKSYVAKNRCMFNGFHYAWNISGKEEAIVFLENIIPFLIVKKSCAEVLLSFCKGFERTKFCKEGISPDQLEFREKHYHQLIHLNKNGVYKFPLMDSERPKQADEAQAEQSCSVID